MSVVKCKATNVAPRVSALRRAPSILQCLRNPVEPLIDVSDLVLQGFHLRPRCRVQDTGRRSASRALNHRELFPLAERREQRELGRCTSCKLRLPSPPSCLSLLLAQRTAEGTSLEIGSGPD
jgi:hypothetical protein